MTVVTATATAPPASAIPAAPGPTDAELLMLAAAHPEYEFPRHAPLSAAHNAHYTNTRAQLAYALEHSYNELEGDVRFRDGIAVMAHDSDRAADLTFEQWAIAVARSGRMLRIDLKDIKALPGVMATVKRLGIPADRLSFNVSVYMPFMSSNASATQLDDLRARFPESYITFNLPFPALPGYWLVEHSAHRVGGPTGVALMGQLATASAIAHLRKHGVTVNVWNHPPLWAPEDVAAETARLRALGVDGQIDLRREDDPLAGD